MSELLTYFQSQRDQMVDFLTTLINFETPTTDKAHVDKIGDFLAAEFERLGAAVTRIPQTEVGDFLLAKWNADAPGKPLMFLIHQDTVWPLGTLAKRPPTIDADGKLFGPGAVDMKGGITIATWSIRGLVERGELPNRPIWILATSDEEVGSIHSEQVIRDTAAQCGLVMVMEPATKEEALKTWRKGVGTYHLSIEGRASHAGNAPEQGINAVVELAQQIMAINALNDLRNGTSVSVTVVKGGIASNVIPDHAEAEIDVRTMTDQAWAGIQEKLNALQSFVPGSTLHIEAHHARGPMEHNEQMVRTYAQCKAIGERYGLSIHEDGSGGGSDGNFTAHMGIPTLDGLGPQGDGLHALHEHVVINSLPRRATLLAAMLKEWACE
ncbi:MAG: M20 family metallopeptidase [Anaerolineaceae bacterium]|nr:M20 family metallopeptidase [Anaerolineaceae bacterium]